MKKMNKTVEKLVPVLRVIFCLIGILAIALSASASVEESSSQIKVEIERMKSIVKPLSPDWVKEDLPYGYAPTGMMAELTVRAYERAYRKRGYPKFNREAAVTHLRENCTDPLTTARCLAAAIVEARNADFAAVK